MFLTCFLFKVIMVYTAANAATLTNSSTIHSNMTLQRLTALRALMASQPTALSAYIIPTADAHNSEYIASVDARREWISGFTGSAGTALVTSSHALVWTDGRYYTQFEKETDNTLWTLMKMSLTETLTMEKWLTTNLVEGSVVGADPKTMSRDEWTPLQTALKKAKMELIAVPNNLVDQVRVQTKDAPPRRPHNEILPLHVKYTGKASGKKIEELREKMKEKKASALVITALDEVAYTLNLRGSDIQYNPVFFSYLVITTSSAKLFWGDGTLSQLVIDHLTSEGATVQCRPYDSIVEYLHELAKELSESGDGSHAIWLSSDASEAIHRASAGETVLKKPLDLISEVSPVALTKLIKNEVELQGFRNCHVKDGIAVVRFFKWLHEEIGKGCTITEIQAADKLLEFRSEEEDFLGPSFETIAGAGENGAIIHYSPSKGGEQRVIGVDDMFLLDSGGQYRDGTTDITRTRHMGVPSAGQKDAFTRVLKGQIMVGSSVFPQGVKGNVLDSFARQHLWLAGLDYAHGTGHGVGHCLNVHEGPSGVSWRPYPHDPGLRPRQILSNEPGYYKVGEYGIRHEDLVEIISITKESDHPRARGLLGDFEGRGALAFSTLTLVPHHKECLDINLLDDFEVSYINAYHARVLNTLGPILEARNLSEDYTWLKEQCAPIVK
ncbi:PREDICTED: xaa-Pro aminopeptidase 1-like isoform X1 [Papilio polytes]|uniref:xaa-Pro aminopeptidase 1-like isoform X1 n=2 Tax=Papilio polytes TaxID=76194 RepID=UPI000676860C|nr:PREDICTED: xaa-Pro aminopeptidase 1-like isoform X1 [Papilio polytes]